MVYLKVLFWILPGETKENNEKPKPEQVLAWLGVELGTSKVSTALPLHQTKISSL
jgi:hypothetical protein